MSEYVGETHTDMDFPGDVAEEMLCVAFEQAAGKFIADVASQLERQPELWSDLIDQDKFVRDLRVTFQAVRQTYEGIAPATIDLTVTIADQ